MAIADVVIPKQAVDALHSTAAAPAIVISHNGATTAVTKGNQS
jgi:hypothetical protein